MRKHLRFQGGDAFVGEAEVGAGAFESFLRGSVFPGRLLDSPFSTLFGVKAIKKACFDGLK
ncbi:hypothetical protein ABZX74_26760 [Streptomyces olivaceoviridis]|uniref:hypothetical protein n=1 Tax=Streptomyces olivaceoviridis TaxID=1921 RepID=UPI0033AE5FC6